MVEQLIKNLNRTLDYSALIVNYRASKLIVPDCHVYP
jgi:hypothetical protein